MTIIFLKFFLGEWHFSETLNNDPSAGQNYNSFPCILLVHEVVLGRVV